MIIKEVILENIQCYYGTKSFEFSNGLNIVLGANGEGKTKFIEAFEWLFIGSDIDLESLISKKKLAENPIGKSFEVGVSIVVLQYDYVHTLRRYFTVIKTSAESYEFGKSQIEGTTENNKGERTKIDNAEFQLESVFPSTLRKYSIFKGEEELNIFDNKDTLINLINKFSSAKSFDKYNSRVDFLVKKADDALNTELGRDNRSRIALRGIESQIQDLDRQKEKFEEELAEKSISLEFYEKQIKRVESQIENAEEIQKINDKIKKHSEEKHRIQSIKDDYSTYLFDEKWILKHFLPIQEEYNKKVSDFVKERNQQEIEFNVEKGRKSAIALTLINDSMPLPINTPSKSALQEMISDQICKVCNREAKIGSDSHNYILNKLQAFIESESSASTKTKAEDVLFKNSYIKKIEHVNDDLASNSKFISGINDKIKDHIELNTRIKNQVSSIEEKIDQLEAEKIAKMGKSSVGEDTLTATLNNYLGWNNDVRNYSRDVDRLKNKIITIDELLIVENEKKDKIYEKGGGDSIKLTRIKEVFVDLKKIISDTKNQKFNDFVSELEDRSNEKFSLINSVNFTGKISIQVNYFGNRVQAEIDLLDEFGHTFKSNKSLDTSMNIAILLAISDLTLETQEERFPFLMDAPVSSFDGNKKTDFLNVLYKSVEQQTIIFLKDYLLYDKENDRFEIMSDFEEVKKNKGFWIKLKRPFDSKKLSSLDTIIENI